MFRLLSILKLAVGRKHRQLPSSVEALNDHLLSDIGVDRADTTYYARGSRQERETSAYGSDLKQQPTALRPACRCIALPRESEIK